MSENEITRERLREIADTPDQPGMVRCIPQPTMLERDLARALLESREEVIETTAMNERQMETIARLRRERDGIREQLLNVAVALGRTRVAAANPPFLVQAAEALRDRAEAAKARVSELEAVRAAAQELYDLDSEKVTDYVNEEGRLYDRLGDALAALAPAEEVTDEGK